MILDTTFIIDLMRRNESALATKDRLLTGNETFRISSATVFELWSGIAASDKAELEKAKVLAAMKGVDLIGISRVVAEKAGEVHGTLVKEGKAIDHIDAMIAATAMLENETVLTRNTKHFTRVTGLKVESY